MEKAIEKFLINLANLIKVKTIITLVIICGVTYGFVVGLVQPEVYCTLAGAIVTYYFTKKKETDI